jgi:hypothetical protein
MKSVCSGLRSEALADFPDSMLSSQWGNGMPEGVFRATLKASATHCALAFFHQAEAFSFFGLPPNSTTQKDVSGIHA